MSEAAKYEAIVIGSSAGGLNALTDLFKNLPPRYPVPIIVVQHRRADEKELLENVLQHKCRIKIKQADEKESIQPGIVYVAPPDYHLLVEADKTFSLSCDPPFNYSRPSIDILFESAAESYGKKLAGIILTGANADGANGIYMINSKGGTTFAQAPDEAEHPTMPQAAIKKGGVQHVKTLNQLTHFLMEQYEQ